MSDEKKSIFHSAANEARRNSDVAYDRQEQIDMRQREVVEDVKPLFLALLGEIPDPFRVNNIRFDSCIIFRVMFPDNSVKYHSEKGMYWEMGIYPYGLPAHETPFSAFGATATACRLRILLVSSSGVEKLWSNEAYNSLQAFELVSKELGELVGREISYLNRR